MALISCPECGHQVSEHAAACPQCGAPVSLAKEAAAAAKPVEGPEAMPANTYDDGQPGLAKFNGKLIAIWVLLGIIVVSWGSTFFYCSSKPQEPNPRARRARPAPANLAPDPAIVAQAGAKEIVKGALKAPATAQFRGVKTIERSGAYYLQEVEVDAENSYGALLRNRFLVILRVQGDSWHWKEGIAVIEAPADAATLAGFKALNGWPE